MLTTPNGPGLKAIGRRIRFVPFPEHFFTPTNTIKYAVGMNPSIWLEDYRLACRAGSANDDDFII